MTGKTLFILLGLTLSGFSSVYAADSDGGSMTVFDPDRDIPPRLLSHDSTSMETTDDMIPTKDSRTEGEPTRPSLVSPDTLKTVPDRSKPASPSDNQ